MSDFADILAVLRADAEPERPARRKSKPAFAAQGQIDGAQLALAVDHVGTLELPLGQATAQRLHSFGEPARFGLREKTLLDPSVRRTAEIAGEHLALTWDDPSRIALLQQLAAVLGIEALDCRVHSLLVYGPGEFFKPHQDTEKTDGMVGTLVLVWPCAHIGGALRIQLGEQEVRFESQQLGQTSALRWCAFYGDCRHEVEPVIEGWRVALTFDLLVPAGAPMPEIAANPALTALLRALFCSPAGERAEPFVFLLDHEYSEHGLYWRLLKGRDRQYAQALRAAAGAAGLSVHLALAQHHEIWNAEYRGRHAQPHKGELIDDEITLDFWRDCKDQTMAAEPVSVRPQHVARLVESGEEHLENFEHEGYMGNYGDTLEYWYRRAAVVIQSPLGALRIRFKADIDSNLDELLALAAHPGRRKAMDAIVAAVHDLISKHIRKIGQGAFHRVARIAANLSDAQMASELIVGFDPDNLLASDGPLVGELERIHGAPWMRNLLQAWSDRRMRYSPIVSYTGEVPTPRVCPKGIADLLQSAISAGLSRASAGHWLSDAFSALKRYDASRQCGSPASRHAVLGATIDAVAELVQAFTLVPDHPALMELVRHIDTNSRNYPSEALGPIVRALESTGVHGPGSALRASVIAALELRLSRPERTAGDAALRELEWTCRCKDCAAMIHWAESTGAEPLLLPMAEPRRLHLIDQIGRTGAPLAHRTIKSGNPYRLELTKPIDLAQRDRQRRAHWREALTQLTQDPNVSSNGTTLRSSASRTAPH